MQHKTLVKAVSQLIVVLCDCMCHVFIFLRLKKKLNVSSELHVYRITIGRMPQDQKNKNVDISYNNFTLLGSCLLKISKTAAAVT